MAPDLPRQPGRAHGRGPWAAAAIAVGIGLAGDGGRPPIAMAAAEADEGTRLVVEAYSGSVRGMAAAADHTRLVTVTLAAHDGAPRAVGSVRLWPGSVEWRVDLRDGQGRAVLPQGGDALVAQVDEERAAFSVPRFQMQIDREAGRIAGVTTPGLTLAITATGQSAASIADAAGAFAVQLAGSLRADTELVVDVIDAAGHRLRLERTVPWARVSVRPGDVVGSSGPGALVAGELIDAAGGTRASGVARADARGGWRLWLRDASGRRARPTHGDVVRIRDPDGQRDVPVHGPGTTFRADGTITGIAVPGSHVEAYVWSPWRPGEEATIATAADGDGRWLLRPPWPPDAATHAYVTVQLAIGDELFDCHQLPALHAQVGSPIVEVEALYDVETVLALVRAGSVVARGAVAQRWSGSARVWLRSVPDGDPVAVAAGDVLEGTLDGQAVILDVRALAAGIEGEPPRLVGSASPGDRIGLAVGGRATAETTVADAQGRFALPLGDAVMGAGLRPGVEASAFLRLPGGHTVQGVLRGPSFDVVLGATRQRARATAGRAVTITHEPAGGSPATRHARADAAGWAAFDLAQPLRADDMLWVDDGWTRSGLFVPVLQATFDPEALQIDGEAPPLAGLVVEADVAGEGLPLRWVALSEPSGRWQLDLALPPGEPALQGQAADHLEAIHVHVPRPDEAGFPTGELPHIVRLAPLAFEGNRPPGRIALPWLASGIERSGTRAAPTPSLNR